MSTTRYQEDYSCVTHFLKDNIGLYYCDDCLYEESKIGSSSQANTIRRRLLTFPNSYDEGTECDFCGKTRTTIAFLPRIYHLGPYPA
jgi:hypothetical protein